MVWYFFLKLVYFDRVFSITSANKKKIKKNYQQSVEKEVQELNCFKKFRVFILLCVNYYLIECEDIYCSACDFIVNLWCLFAQNLLTSNVENLQEFCRVNNHIFFKLRTVSCLLDENEGLKNLLEQLNLPSLTKKMESI